MKKTTRFLCIGALLAFVGLGAACNGDDSSGDKTASTVSFIGVQELHLKVGEANAEKLLQNVSVKLPDGTTAKPTLLAADVDYTKAGDYSISYEYGGQKVKTALYLYAMPQVYLDGTAITEDSLTISYREANESFDFEKGVQIKDSFGEILEMQKTDDSEEYDGGLGEYTVKYTATDKAGNVLSKTVTYVVESTKMPEITDYEYEIGGSYEIPLNAYGEKSGWLYENGELVPTEYFTLTANSLKFEQSYLLELGLGEHDFELKTAEGFADFSLTIVDKGKPIFEIPEMAKTYDCGTIRVAYPTGLWSAHEAYTYEYSLSGASGFMLAEEQAENVLLLTPSGDDLDGGAYTLTVTATSADGTKTTTTDYDFTVNDKSTPTLMPGERASFTKTTFENEEVYLWSKQDGSSAYAGRLSFTLPASRYMALTFDMYVQSSTVATEDGKANLGLAGQIGATNEDLAANYNYREIDASEGVMDKTTGEFINRDDIKVGKWYTVIFKTDKCVKKLGANLYFGAFNDNKSGAEVYMKNITFHEKGNVDVIKSGSSAFAPALIDESVYGTKVAYKYVNNGYDLWTGRFETRYIKTERAQLEFDVYIDSCSLAEGTKANAGVQVNANISGADVNLVDKNFGVIDKATGEYVATADMQLGKWYTVTVETNKIPNANTTIYWYFAAANTVAYLKDFRYVDKITYDGPRITAPISAARAGFKITDTSANTALGVAKAWEYNKLASTAAWDARLTFTHDGNYDTLTFDVYIAESTNAASGKANVYMRGCIGTDYGKFSSIVEKGSTTAIASDDMQTGKWYTVTYNLANVAADTSCYIYFDITGAGIGVKAYFNNFNYA